MPADSSCFHCNEPLPQQHPQAFAGEIDGETHYFCCPACRTVASTIRNLGLTQYYRQRDSKPEHAASSAEDYSDMDLLATQPQFVQENSDGSCEAKLFIADIHCASCCWLIEKRLQHLAGVSRADTQLNNHKLTVRWQKDTLRFSEIFAALADIGYRASPWQPTQQQELLRQRQKQLLQRLGVAGLLGMQVHMIAMGSYFGALPDVQQWMNAVALLLSLPVWFYSADTFFISAWRSLRGSWQQWHKYDKSAAAPISNFAAGMDVPVALAIAAAALTSIIGVVRGNDEVYFDSIAMFVFLLLGARFLEAQARNRIATLSQEPMLPQTCTRMDNGSAHRIAIDSLQQHDLVQVTEASIVPVDGIITEGAAAIEQAVITGEFLPVQKQVGDQVLAGTTIISGGIVVKTQQWGAQSHIAQLHQRMEQALLHKQGQSTSLGRLYDGIAQFFTPVVLLTAVASALFWSWADPARALTAFLAVLVASCPCALSLAIPAAMTAATLQLRRQGILITSAHVLHTLPRIAHYVFDKTGTLTLGRMQLLQIQTCAAVSSADCLAIAAALEQHSSHPMASAFTTTASEAAGSIMQTGDVRPFVHCGIEGSVNGQRYRIGKTTWACQLAGTTPPLAVVDTTDITIALASESGLLAMFTLGDSLRSDSAGCIQQLQQHAIQCTILSGDHSGSVDNIALQLAITDVHKSCSPEQKVAVIDSMKQRHPVAMIGDGVNDGPVLAHADISIALAEASQTAQLAADVILLNNRLSDLLVLRNTSLRTRTLVRQNLAWALLYNIAILPIAAAGLLPPVIAAIGMAISSLLVTLNGLRLFAKGKA